MRLLFEKMNKKQLKKLERLKKKSNPLRKKQQVTIELIIECLFGVALWGAFLVFFMHIIG